MKYYGEEIPVKTVAAKWISKEKENMFWLKARLNPPRPHMLPSAHL